MVYTRCDTTVKLQNAAAFTKAVTEVLAWTCTAHEDLVAMALRVGNHCTVFYNLYYFIWNQS